MKKSGAPDPSKLRVGSKSGVSGIKKVKAGTGKSKTDCKTSKSGGMKKY